MGLTITEAAQLNRVSRQAIFIAIYSERLKATKKGRMWNIEIKDLQEYERNKYDRKFSSYEGEPLFDSEKGEYSVTHASEHLKVSIQHVYYAIRMKRMKAFRKNKTWVIKEEDLEQYKKFRNSYNKRLPKSA